MIILTNTGQLISLVPYQSLTPATGYSICFINCFYQETATQHRGPRKKKRKPKRRNQKSNKRNKKKNQKLSKWKIQTISKQEVEPFKTGHLALLGLPRSNRRKKQALKLIKAKVSIYKVNIRSIKRLLIKLNDQRIIQKKFINWLQMTGSNPSARPTI